MFDAFQDSLEGLGVNDTKQQSYCSMLALFPVNPVLHYMEVHLDGSGIIDLSVCYSTIALSNAKLSNFTDSMVCKVTRLLALDDNKPDFIWFEKDDCTTPFTSLGIHTTVNVLNVFTYPKSICDEKLAKTYQSIILNKPDIDEQSQLTTIVSHLHDGKLIHVSSLKRHGIETTKYHIKHNLHSVSRFINDIQWQGNIQLLNALINVISEQFHSADSIFIDLSSANGTVLNQLGIYLSKSMCNSHEDFKLSLIKTLKTLSSLNDKLMNTLVSEVLLADFSEQWLDVKLSITQNQQPQIKFYFGQIS